MRNGRGFLVGIDAYQWKKTAKVPDVQHNECIISSSKSAEFNKRPSLILKVEKNNLEIYD